jgi:hypothetical protein
LPHICSLLHDSTVRDNAPIIGSRTTPCFVTASVGVMRASILADGDAQMDECDRVSPSANGAVSMTSYGAKEPAMWRSFFLAIGAYCCLLGVEALTLEKAVVKVDPTSEQTALRDIVPPDWAPWSLLAAGAVVMLYSFTIPQRVGGG